MKKLPYLLILLCLITSPCYALTSAIQAVCGSSGAAGPVYTDCSNAGTLSFYYTGDYTGDTDKACTSTTTTKDGTASNASFVVSGTDPGTASPESAGNVIKMAHASGYVSYALASCTGGNCDIVNADEGQLSMDVYLSATTNTNGLYRLRYDGNNDHVVSVDLNGSIVFNAISAGNTCAVQTANGAISDATWSRLCLRWSDANNKIGIAVIATSASCDSASYKTACPSGCDVTDADCLGTFAGAPTIFRITNGSAGGDAVYVDNVKIKKTSGF